MEVDRERDRWGKGGGVQKNKRGVVEKAIWDMTCDVQHWVCDAELQGCGLKNAVMLAQTGSSLNRCVSRHMHERECAETQELHTDGVMVPHTHTHTHTHTQE